MSQVASAISQTETYKSIAWRYSLAGERDLRIDFMRGIALVMMVVAHTEVMSIFNIFSWERFGLTTGAEGFVILSGFMLGMLNRTRLQKAVLLTVGWGLYLRAWKIYQVNIIIIVTFLLLRYLMRWSLPPSQYYAEDRLSFGEPSWKTLRLLVSIWVRTLSIFIVRIIVGRPFTVKNSPDQS
ncbi:OpgC domain-containing protein [Klebsiella pneumoniae]|uniref:OpgC domain-containing protein n=1 Tax=Klebsiella pneumoniae TaxID=573 RepID=UPI00390CB36F